jgi:hypothetical protein
LDSRLFAQSSNDVIDVDQGPLDNVAQVRDADAAPPTDVVVKLNCFTSSPFEAFSLATEEGFTEVSESGGSDSLPIRPVGNMRCKRGPLGAAIDAASEHEVVASAYLEKYGHFADAERYSRAMTETAAELLDGVRRSSVYPLLRLEPVP